MSRRHRGVYEHPRGSGCWWIHYYDGAGRRRREKVGRYQRAVNLYLRRQIEKREGHLPPAGRRQGPAFADLADLAMAAKKPRLAARSYSTDQSRLRRLKELFAGLKAAQVTPGVIEEKFQALHAEEFSTSTINRYRALLSSVFSFAVQTGQMTANPVRRVKGYPESDARIRFLSADEEEALRQAIVERFAQGEAEVDLALHTGMRRGEQFDLRWDQVDLERGLLTVFGKRKPSGERRRFVPINRAARAALEKLYAQSAGSEYVCPGRRRPVQTDWRRWFEECAKSAGILNFTWHDLRHTFASRLVMAGVDLASVQKLLGHRSITTTMRYAHLSPGHLLAAVEKLNSTATPTATSAATGTGRSRQVTSFQQLGP